VDVLQHPIHIDFAPAEQQEPQRPMTPVEEERIPDQEPKKKTFDSEKKLDPHQTDLVLKAIDKFDGHVIR